MKDDTWTGGVVVLNQVIKVTVGLIEETEVRFLQKLTHFLYRLEEWNDIQIIVQDQEIFIGWHFIVFPYLLTVLVFVFSDVFVLQRWIEGSVRG